MGVESRILSNWRCPVSLRFQRMRRMITTMTTTNRTGRYFCALSPRASMKMVIAGSFEPNWEYRSPNLGTTKLIKNVNMTVTITIKSVGYTSDAINFLRKVSVTRWNDMKRANTS